MRQRAWPRPNLAFARLIYPPKPEAVCRAGCRDERSRCAVRMTAKGSVTPWMACGSRPVKRIPELGAFPTVGLRPGPGLPRGRPFPPWSAPANGRLANRPSRWGGTDQAGSRSGRRNPAIAPNSRLANHPSRWGGTDKPEFRF